MGKETAGGAWEREKLMVIDKILKGNRRRLRTSPENILMDASGYRMWADYLEVRPGFVGRIDFIHKINIPCLFRVVCDILSNYEPAKIKWKPSHVAMTAEKAGIYLKEQKFITLEDAAVSCMVWENRGDRPFTLTFIPGTEDGTFATTYGKKLSVRYFINGQEGGRRDWILQPQGRLELCIAAQVCLEGETERMEEGCRRIQECFCEPQKALRAQKEAYQSWFECAPSFTSDDAQIDRIWAYRWYVLRHNMMRPELGNLKETYFCEGRSHKMGKTPYQPDGWEFTKLIPLSVPMHLLDLRWYGEKEYGISTLHVMRDNQDENGEFRCAKVDWHGNPYANFFGWSVWQYYLVSGDLSYAREALPVVKRQIQGWKKVYGNENDRLLIQYVHQLTGMEYQPSYWYFHDFPKDCMDKETYTPVKRVDRNVYHYLNTLAAAYLGELCLDPETDAYRKEAEGIREDILRLMWDEETGFFYDLHYQTNEKAKVKNIVGFLPYFAGMGKELGADGAKRGMEHLFLKEFSTPCPFPSVSTDCPVFTAEGGWQGQFFKGRNRCIWNGPAWPFSNSMVLDALARESLRRGHVLDEKFGEYFRKFTGMHYHGGDGSMPYLVEHYNSMTGECISDDVDYSHSYYIDLVVRYVAGICVGPDRIVVEPVDIGLDHFRLSGLRIRGHEVTVCLETGDGRLSVTVDGEERGSCLRPWRLEVPI